MRVDRKSPCKINLLLNIIGKRADGYHELETVMLPVPVFDEIRIERIGSAGIRLSCSAPSIPADSTNLVHRAAERFLKIIGASDGLRIHLEKRIPAGAGLGGGSSNAANTLLGLNHLFENALSDDKLQALAAQIGSDVPFFLQPSPALATGRGELIEPVGLFSALAGMRLLLIYPGFGVSTAWAYGRLAEFPDLSSGMRGRGREFVALLSSDDFANVAPAFFNSLEKPVFRKYPILAEYQAFLKAHDAVVTLMSGSGSSTFAIFRDDGTARAVEELFRNEFGDACWIVSLPL